MDDAARKALSDRVRSLVERARYREALSLTEDVRRSYPSDPFVRYRHAVLIGDAQEGLSAKTIEANRRLAARSLRSLMPRLRGFDALTRFRVRNEYYWFSRQPQKQYRLGCEAVKSGIWRGYYSQGVGAAWHALALARMGRHSRAHRWAGFSEKAWARFMKRQRYYNAYIHLGLALGVQGRLREMKKALQAGARLCGRPRDWHEFAEIRRIIARLPRY